tara:strand:+ start:19 stop:1431 length:1413 start_codon:yes stop_codon:yes gene_type:complete
MNLRGISFYLGLFCFPISLLAFINILYSYYFEYFLSIQSYFVTMFFSLTLGLVLYFYGKLSEKKINYIEQLVLILFVYFLISFFIAIPFYLSNFEINILDALFESISGLTGTGFSTFNNIKYFDPTLILWRSSSQWIGGLFFLLFLTILFSNKIFNYKMTNLTFSGDSNVKSEENVKNNILKIFIYYCIFSFTLLIFLNFSGIRLFNSLNLTMTLISGGGFLPSNNLSEIISTNFQKIILIIALIFSFLNFYLFINLFDREKLTRYHKEDFYLLILVFILILPVFISPYNVLNSIINVLSSLANSGITLTKSNNNFSLFFLFITIIGGSLISNSSGIKLSRFYILVKITSSEILKLISPNTVINKTIFNSDIKITDENIKISFLIFISFFISLIFLSSLLAFDSLDFESSFKLSVLALTNTVNSEIFELQNLDFSSLLTSSKISLIIFMIIGKIELISIFLIFKKVFFRD